MDYKAIALCRVSTSEQAQNNSLNRQEQNALKAANKLNAEIVAEWTEDVSSKVGSNLKRKDLQEMFDYCKRNKDVDYLIVDEVDRFMRSMGEMFYWIIQFEQIGVNVHFASNPGLNTNDAQSRLLLSLDAFKAEGSNEERQRKSINGHVAAIKEGRYTFPPKPGYTKGQNPGIHVPHHTEFKPLQVAMQEVASLQYSPAEALKRLNMSEFSKTRSRMKIDKFKKWLQDPYYMGVVEVNRQVCARNENGLHTPMISKEEFELIQQALSKRKTKHFTRKQSNPEFPMSKLLKCEDCDGGAKFTGAFQGNGKGGRYPKYRCRGCGKQYKRSEVHNQVGNKLSRTKLSLSRRDDLLGAIKLVHAERQKDAREDYMKLKNKLSTLEEQKHKRSLQVLDEQNPNLKEAAQKEIDKLQVQIEELNSEIIKRDNFEDDLAEFAEFALNFIDSWQDKWWDLEPEDRLRCQQLVFNNEILFNSEKKVSTPTISPLLSQNSTKKDPSISKESLLVELRGIAPRSAG